jgi:enediyne biosynthesis protein E3
MRIDTVYPHSRILISPLKLVINAWKFFRRQLFSLAPEQTSFSRRGFHAGTDCIRQRLEAVGSAFVTGYNLALEHSPERIGPELKLIAPELRGFGFEGASMGFALLDGLTPWRKDRVSQFLQGDGNDHAYMVHVGIGWVWARLPLNFRRIKARLDPSLGWLAFDGWGFHEGFFHWPKYIAGKPSPKKLCGYERRVFDQGLGRSFWFVRGGNVELIAQTISNFSPDRQPDLWSGIGLAATYAGIVSESLLSELCQKSGPFRSHLAQGAAFAAKARQRAGNVTDYTGLATSVFCNMSAPDAAQLCDKTLENLPDTTNEPAYEIWRRRIQDHFATKPQSLHSI